MNKYVVSILVACLVSVSQTTFATRMSEEPVSNWEYAKAATALLVCAGSGAVASIATYAALHDAYTDITNRSCANDHFINAVIAGTYWLISGTYAKITIDCYKDIAEQEED